MGSGTNNRYRVRLWKTSAYCKKNVDNDACLYEREVEAESDYMAREKAIRLSHYGSRPTDVPIIYEVIHI